eukprot:scpid90917/ scgid10402/ 
MNPTAGPPLDSYIIHSLHQATVSGQCFLDFWNLLHEFPKLLFTETDSFLRRNTAPIIHQLEVPEVNIVTTTVFCHLGTKQDLTTVAYTLVDINPSLVVRSTSSLNSYPSRQYTTTLRSKVTVHCCSSNKEECPILKKSAACNIVVILFQKKK